MENKKDNSSVKYITLFDNDFNNAYCNNESVGSVIKFNNIVLQGSYEEKAEILANKVAFEIIEQCKDCKDVKIVLSLFLHGEANNNTKTHNLVYDNARFDTLTFYNCLLQELEKYPDVIKSIFINTLSCHTGQIFTNTKSELKKALPCHKNLQSAIYTSSTRANSIENALFMNRSMKNYQFCDIIDVLKIACIYGIKTTLMVEDDDHNLHPIYVKFDLKSVANLKLRLEIFNNKLRELFEVSTFVKNEYGDIKSKDGEVAFENLKKDFEKKFSEHEQNPDLQFKMIFVSIFNQLAYNRRESEEKKAKYNEFCQSDIVQNVLTEILMMMEKQPDKYEKEYKALFLNLLLFSMAVVGFIGHMPFSGSAPLYFNKFNNLSKFAKQFLETSSKLTLTKLFSYEEPLNYHNFINYAVIGLFQKLKNKSELNWHELSIVNLYALQKLSYDRALKLIEILKKNQNTFTNEYVFNGINFLQNVNNHVFELFCTELFSKEHPLNVNKIMSGSMFYDRFCYNKNDVTNTYFFETLLVSSLSMIRKDLSNNMQELQELRIAYLTLFNSIKNKYINNKNEIDVRIFEIIGGDKFPNLNCKIKTLALEYFEPNSHDKIKIFLNALDKNSSFFLDYLFTTQKKLQLYIISYVHKLPNEKIEEFIQSISKNKNKIEKIIKDNKESEMEIAKYIDNIYLKVISKKSTKCSALVKKSAAALLCICVSCGVFLATQSR